MHKLISVSGAAGEPRPHLGPADTERTLTQANPNEPRKRNTICKLHIVLLNVRQLPNITRGFTCAGNDRADQPHRSTGSIQLNAAHSVAG